jgi:hypothetical protein
MGSLSIENKLDGDNLTLSFTGKIDEDTDFSEISVGSPKLITLDFVGVVGINSVGIREWVKWIRSIDPSTKFNVKNCPQIIVDQLNMVEGFLPTGTEINSFFVPYYCESCDELSPVLFEKGKNFDGPNPEVEETMECPNCKEESELDIIEKMYFKFLDK